MLCETQSIDTTRRRPVSWRKRCGCTLATFARWPSSVTRDSIPRAVHGPRLPRNTASATRPWQRLQRFARFDIQRQPPVLVTFADHVDPSRAGLTVDALPGNCHQLVDAQPGVEQQCDDRVGDRTALLRFADEPSALDIGETFRSERLGGDGGQVLGGVAGDSTRVECPTLETAQRGQGGVDRGRPLTLGELSLVLAQVARSGVLEHRLEASLPLSIIGNMPKKPWNIPS
jgi:hypothetical protein